MTRILISLLCLLCTHSIMGQKVGVNVKDPNQALDVGGKIKIGTDGRTPTPGTLAYVSSAGDFWGYTSDGYKSLTKKNNSLPTNPIPLTGFSPNISPGFAQICTLYTWDGTDYTSVPTGKKFIITGLYPTPNGSNPANQYYYLEAVAYTGAQPLDYSRIRLSGYDNNIQPMMGDAAPLIVLNEGEQLRIFSYGNSDMTMNVSIRGFMVDDLDYD